MSIPARPKRDALLMHGMADKLRADLDGALAAGKISREEITEMSTRCTTCTKHDDCILWMIEHDHGAESAPGYCLNAELLQTLKA